MNTKPTPGLRANWRQFWLLVAVNGFVGATVGLERTIVPLLAEREFGIASASAILSFVAAFGLTKAIANLFAGALADRHGRKRVLLAGWLCAIPVPFLIAAAPSWSWVVVANVLLGVNQGLAWSATVIMKLDLVGSRNRGLAMGLNEFAGYVAVGAMAYATGVIAEQFGLRPEPMYLGVVIVSLGLGLSLVLVRETLGHARLEASESRTERAPKPSRSVVADVSWRDRGMMSCSQAGLINNANDGVAWGLLPVLFASRGLGLEQIGVLAATYPIVWGSLQLVAGPLSDRWGRKLFIVTGMTIQGAALLVVAGATGYNGAFLGMALLGFGTALVYPTLLAAMSDLSPPLSRGMAIGAYRFWRDMGYFVVAVGAGLVTDRFGLQPAIVTAAVVSTLSGGLVILYFPGARR